MGRKVDIVLQACKKFVGNIHNEDQDRCTMFFCNNLVHNLGGLMSHKADVLNRLGNAETSGSNHLYRCLCHSVDYMCKFSDTSRPWLIVAVTHRNDKGSSMSAYECEQHILSKYTNKNHAMFVVSVGDMDRTELERMTLNGALYHIQVGSFMMLEAALLLVASKAIDVLSKGRSADSEYIDWEQLKAQRHLVGLSAIDYHIIVSTSRSMGESLENTSTIPKLGTATINVSGHSAVSAQNTINDSDIKMREFINTELHPDDAQIFREFAASNYPGVSTRWEDEDIKFLVVIERKTRCIIGMLITQEHHYENVHINLIVVDKEYRDRGVGTKMLIWAASRYHDKTVTLNVAYDKLGLLEFYHDKGYARIVDVLTQQKVLVMSLNHWNLLSKIPLPDYAP